MDELNKGESQQLAEIVQGLDKPLLDIATDISVYIEHIYEFIDKGQKGLLTGDLSVYLIKTIEDQTNNFQTKLFQLANEIEDLVEKKETFSAFLNSNFSSLQGIDVTTD